MILFRRIVMVSFASATLHACASAPKAVVKAPQEVQSRMARARQLYLQEGKPVEAEQLLQKAIREATAAGDDRGLAEGLQQYAYLLASPAVEKERSVYQRNGFADKSVTWNTRLQKSIEYFDRAAPIYARLKRFDRLTDNSVGRGIAYTNLKNADEACASFDQGMSFREEAVRNDPALKLSVPKGYRSWDAYVSGLQKWAGCGG